MKDTDKYILELESMLFQQQEELKALQLTSSQVQQQTYEFTSLPGITEAVDLKNQKDLLDEELINVKADIDFYYSFDRF